VQSIPYANILPLDAEQFMLVQNKGFPLRDHEGLRYQYPNFQLSLIVGIELMRAAEGHEGLSGTGDHLYDSPTFVVKPCFHAGLLPGVQ
jgi:hypothetical protein